MICNFASKLAVLDHGRVTHTYGNDLSEAIQEADMSVSAERA